MRKTIFFIFLFLFVFASYVSAVPETNVSYFFSPGCGHCQNVADSGILERADEITNVTVIKYDTSSPFAREKFLSYIEKFGIDRAGVPFLVIEQGENSTYLMGDRPIIDSLESEIENMSPSSPGNGNDLNLTLPLVIITALIDSVNPCAFGVLLFLMAILISMGSPKRAFKYGMIYSFIIFVVYLLAGLGLMRIISSLSILEGIKTVVAILIIIAALVEFKDFFFEGKWFSLKIPVSSKPLLEKYARKGTLPAIIILGALVALVELPCTGLIYLGILSLIAENGAKGILYLVIYNLIFVLPLVFLTWVIYRGAKTDSINNWVQKNKKYMRAAAGIIMILIALFLLRVL